MLFHTIKKLSILFICSTVLSACSQQATEIAPSEIDLDKLAPSSSGVDLPNYAGFFDNASIIGTPKIVECTLSGGAVTSCLSVTVHPQPKSVEIGPWCPKHISDGADVSGIWLDDGKVYDADGGFIQNLSSFYADDAWQMFDADTGKINVTDTQVSCEAAARPDVDPQYQNHCVECQIDYLPEGTTQTYVLPLTPVIADRIADRVGRSGVGLAFSGARLDASAPVDAILSAHTLAPFDDCGGHINTNIGYHVHAVTDSECYNSVPSSSGHAAAIGVAMDGYQIHARLDKAGNEAGGLDQCRGHATDELAYHYHANEAGANAIIGCHRGQTGCSSNSRDAVCDASKSTRRGPPPRRE